MNDTLTRSWLPLSAVCHGLIWIIIWRLQENNNPELLKVVFSLWRPSTLYLILIIAGHLYLWLAKVRDYRQKVLIHATMILGALILAITLIRLTGVNYGLI